MEKRGIDRYTPPQFSIIGNLGINRIQRTPEFLPICLNRNLSLFLLTVSRLDNLTSDRLFFTLYSRSSLKLYICTTSKFLTL